MMNEKELFELGVKGQVEIIEKQLGNGGVPHIEEWLGDANADITIEKKPVSMSGRGRVSYWVGTGEQTILGESPTYSTTGGHRYIKKTTSKINLFPFDLTVIFLVVRFKHHHSLLNEHG